MPAASLTRRLVAVVVPLSKTNIPPLGGMGEMLILKSGSMRTRREFVVDNIRGKYRIDQQTCCGLANTD